MNGQPLCLDVYGVREGPYNIIPGIYGEHEATYKWYHSDWEL